MSLYIVNYFEMPFLRNEINKSSITHIEIKTKK